MGRRGTSSRIGWHSYYRMSPKLSSALERVARTELGGLHPAPAARPRNRFRCGCRVGPRILCLRATIRIGGTITAARGRQGLSQTLQGFLPKPGLDPGIRSRCATVCGCLRSRATRLRYRREGASLAGLGHRLLGAFISSFGAVLRQIPNLAGKRRGLNCRSRRVCGFDGCVQRQEGSLKLDGIEYPLDALARTCGPFQLSPQSVHTVSIRASSVGAFTAWHGSRQVVAPADMLPRVIAQTPIWFAGPNACGCKLTGRSLGARQILTSNTSLSQ